MLNIEKNAPQIDQYLATDGPARSLSEKTFTMILIDQMIEMTIKSGVTENKGTNERLMRINHFHATLKQHLDLKIQREQLSQHAEFSKIKIKKDEDHVKRVVAGLILWLPDIWKKERPLVNVCDGTPSLMFVMVKLLLMKWFEKYYLLEKRGMML